MDALLSVAAPELEIGKVASQHAGTIMFMPLIGFGIILIIIGIIVLAAAKSKAPGGILTFLGFLLAAGGGFGMIRAESNKK
jgi:hypothetical protein